LLLPLVLIATALVVHKTFERRTDAAFFRWPEVVVFRRPQQRQALDLGEIGGNHDRERHDQVVSALGRDE
jgi:hypothetical protein